MAATYVTTGSNQTVRVLSQTGVVAVEAIGIYTKPYDVYVVVQVPLAAFKAGNYAKYLEVTSELIVSLFNATPDPGQRLVTGASYVQDIDSSGLLSAYLALTVSYTPTSGYQGTFSEIVTLPMTTFETGEAFDAPIDGVTPIELITQAYARQRKLANL
jgi:hypothetical protein